VDDALLRHTPGPIAWLLPIIAVILVLPLTSLRPPADSVVRHGLVLLAIAITGQLLFRIVKVVEEVIAHRFELSRDDNLHARAVHTQVRGFRNLAAFGIGVVTIGMMLLTFPGVRQLGAGLLASAGIAGLVLGFAAQRTLGTLMAGVQIALCQPIRVDDVVIVEGEWGRIEEITLTYVVVRIWDDRRLVVPINYFLEKPFQNWTRTSAELTGAVILHVDYAVPLAALRQELEASVQGSELWDQRVCSLQVTDATDRALVVRALVSARNASDAWSLRCAVRERLVSFLQRHHPEALPKLRLERMESSRRPERERLASREHPTARPATGNS
jgi:small-conductance mechanosensitive channel